MEEGNAEEIIKLEIVYNTVFLVKNILLRIGNLNVPSELIGLRKTAMKAHAQKLHSGLTSAINKHAIAEKSDEPATR